MQVFCGDDTDKSKEAFLVAMSRIKESGHQVVWQQGKDMRASDINEVVNGADLFGESSYLFVEKLAAGTKGKARDELKKMLSIASTDKLIVWEDKWDAKFYQGLNVDKKEYKIPAYVFTYLDSIGVAPITTLKSFVQVCEAEPVEKIFRMTVSRVLDLILVKSNPDKFQLSSFYWKKIYQQSQKVDEEDLCRLYFELYKMEKEIKTGTGVVGLEARMELFWQLYRL